MARKRDLKLPDHDLWPLVVRNVIPLSTTIPLQPKQVERVEPAKGVDVNEETPIRKTVARASAPRPVKPQDLSQMDGSNADKLRRGLYPVDYTLDLHGHSLSQAHERLNRVLNQAIGQGWRCLLIVTGKGKLGEGAIRRSLPEWLNVSPHLSRILALKSAPPHQGGEGAYYLLLRRPR